MNQEERLKRILGQKDGIDQDVQQVNICDTSLDTHIGQPSSGTSEIASCCVEDDSSAGGHLTSLTSSSHSRKSEPLNNSFSASQSSKDTESVVDGHVTFRKIRPLLSLLLGVIVRISLIYPFGQDYVQSLINPFVAFEIALIGYQKAVAMDMASGASGGLLMPALILSGVKPEIIQRFKTAMATVNAIMSDFALCFFSFIMIHMVV